MRILCVGKVCLDIVNYLDSYPNEDTDQSIPFQRWTQGGNAANNCVVLSHLKSVFGKDDLECELFGSLGTDLASAYVRRLLEDDRCVSMDRCPILNAGNGLLSTSCIVVNRSSGTRTIVHGRNDVNDVTFEQFVDAKFEYGRYDWIHFETRHVDDTKRMLDAVLSWRTTSQSTTKPVVSVEVEKDRDGTDALLESGVDYLFIGKDFGLSRNCTNMRETVEYVSKFRSADSTVVCPWGDGGACVLERGHGEPYSCRAYRAVPIVDTLGAGDTFFASFVFAKCALGESCENALKFATLVAGLKCGMIGYDDLNSSLNKIITHVGRDYLTSW